MGANNLDEVLALVKSELAKPNDLIKSFVQPSTATTGLQAYSLEAPSKKLYPVLTPLRNAIARIGGGYATQANWKAITNINVGNTRAKTLKERPFTESSASSSISEAWCNK